MRWLIKVKNARNNSKVPSKSSEPTKKSVKSIASNFKKNLRLRKMLWPTARLFVLNVPKAKDSLTKQHASAVNVLAGSVSMATETLTSTFTRSIGIWILTQTSTAKKRE